MINTMKYNHTTWTIPLSNHLQVSWTRYLCLDKYISSVTGSNCINCSVIESKKNKIIMNLKGTIISNYLSLDNTCIYLGLCNRRNI